MSSKVCVMPVSHLGSRTHSGPLWEGDQPSGQNTCTWAMSLPIGVVSLHAAWPFIFHKVVVAVVVGCYHPHLHPSLLSLTADTHFAMPQMEH